MPVHKLVQKRKISRKFGVQTFALIKLNNRRRHHVCVLKSKAHDLLETSTAAWGYGISQEDNDVIYSRYSMGYFQYGGRYNPIIASYMCDSIYFPEADSSCAFACFEVRSHVLKATNVNALFQKTQSLLYNF